MAFRLDAHWVWDFWVADDGDRYHLFYLHAPKALGDPDLRHRNARIGHATSEDLTHWTDHGEVLAPGEPGDFDETATWTGCVVRDEAGLWRMFYTGASFTADGSPENIETIGCAVSEDLHAWRKLPDLVLRADPAHYETLGDTSWPEEAWRDPWVYRDEAGDGWHMLITARGHGAGTTSGGVVGHARSADLTTWTAGPPLGPSSAEFPHLEVLQRIDHGGRTFLTFSAARHPAGGGMVSGVWAVEAPADLEGVDVDTARLIAPDPYYAGRIVRDRSDNLVLLAFSGGGPGSTEAPQGVSDPLPVSL